MAHARGALARRARQDRVDRRERGAGAARRARGVDRGGRRAHSADPVPPDRAQEPRTLPAAGAGERHGALCRRAGRGGVCDDPYLAEDAADLVVLEIEQKPRCSTRCRGGQFDEATRQPSRASSRKATATSTPPSATRMRSCRSSFPSAATPACRMETRGAIARYDEARDVLEMHGAAKVPHWNRDTLAQMLGRPRESVQLYEGHVGGGFGIRGELYPEDVLVCAAALKFRRPVKWIEDRREHLIAANHSRQQTHQVRAAIDAEGRILGIDDEFFHDNGAYMRTHARHRARSRRRHAAGALSRAGLSRHRPHPAHQQDAVRHLSRARPLREHVRARAAARRHRGQRRRRQRRNPPPQSDRPRAPCPTRSASTRSARISSTTPATMPGCSTRRWRSPAGTSCKANSRARREPRRKGRRRPCHVRGEERARAVRHRARRGRRRRRGRGGHRRRLGRPGRRDGDRADLRRRARRRLRAASA